MEYLKPESWMVETEIDVARMLTDLATKEPDPQCNEVIEVREGAGELKVAEGVKKEKAREGTDKDKIDASASQISIGRKGKQILTEAQREAKKLRRILANRESARRTILRRQALRDELAQKVAALSSENQHMKMEKTIIMQDFISLKETNRRLKEQLAQLSIMSQADPGVKQRETEPSLDSSYSGPMRAEMLPYMWVPWTPCMQNYTMCDPTASFSDPSLGFSSNSSLNHQFHKIPSSSSTERYEEKQLLPTVDKTEVSCALTLGLETNTEPKDPAVQKGHDNSTVPEVLACAKELNLLKLPYSGKLAAKARRRRLEIIKLKKIDRMV